MIRNFSVKYAIIIPIFILIFANNILVSKHLVSFIETRSKENFVRKYMTNIKTLIPTIAYSVWEFNEGRVNNTIKSIDDKRSFLFAKIDVESVKFYHDGNQSYWQKFQGLLNEKVSRKLTLQNYFLFEDFLIINYPIMLEKRKVNLVNYMHSSRQITCFRKVRQ